MHPKMHDLLTQQKQLNHRSISGQVSHYIAEGLKRDGVKVDLTVKKSTGK